MCNEVVELMNNDYQSYKEYRNSSPGVTKKPSNKKSGNKKAKLDNKKTKSSNKPGAKSGKSRNLNKRSATPQAANKKSDKLKKQLEQEHTKEMKARAKIEKRQRKVELWHAIKNYKKTFLVACFVVFYIGISMVILYNNSNISELQYKINSLKKDITKEKNLLNELETERESTYKSETIENLAKYRLNMVYPTKDQIVYVKVD